MNVNAAPFIPKVQRRRPMNMRNLASNVAKLLSPTVRPQNVVKAKTKKSKPEASVPTTTRVIEDIRSSVMRLSTNTTFLITCALAVVVISSHSDDTHSGIFHLVSSNYSNTTLGDWLKTNLHKALGLVLFLPSIFTRDFKDYDVMTVIFVSLLVVIMPALTLYQYLLVSACIVLYKNVRLNSTKTVVIIVALCVIQIFTNHPWKIGDILSKSTQAPLLQGSHNTPAFGRSTATDIPK